MQMVRTNSIDTGIPGDQCESSCNVQELSERAKKIDCPWEVWSSFRTPANGFGGKVVSVNIGRVTRMFWQELSAKFICRYLAKNKI